MSQEIKFTIPAVTPSGAKGDAIVSVLLDEVVLLKGWDPAWILPEHTLGQDLEMTTAEVEALAARLSGRLLQSGIFAHAHWAGITLQQVVGEIRGWQLAAS